MMHCLFASPEINFTSKEYDKLGTGLESNEIHTARQISTIFMHYK